MKIKKKIYKYILKTMPFRDNNNYVLIFGNYGIKSLSYGLLTYKNIENLRRKLSKQLKKINKITKSKLYIRT